MKNYLFFLFTVFYVGLSYSQLVVRNNSSVYVKNSFLFVKSKIDLVEPTTTIYLRNESQLLQGTTGSSTNKGLGSLSVFQEGTSNSFRYNFWCSPIGLPTNTPGNSSFGITLLQQPTSNTASTPSFMLASSYNGQSNPLRIATYWIYRYLAGATYSDWTSSGPNTNIATGQGFTMKGTNGFDANLVGEAIANNPFVAGLPGNLPQVFSAQRYDFRGKPNDGDITVTVLADNSTLTGNPYPSALHVNAFLLDPSNSACDGTAYYWDQEKNPQSHDLVNYVGGYGTYKPMSLGDLSGIYVPATYKTYNLDGSINTNNAGVGQTINRKYAPIGQGFMVVGAAGLAGTGTLTIKNSHRRWYKESTPSGQSEFGKHKNEFGKPQNSATLPLYGQIRLKNTIGNLYSRELVLALSAEATDGVDRAMDGKSPNREDTMTDTYFVLDNTEYVIQAVPFALSKRIKLGVKATENNTNISFTLKEIKDFDENQPIYIYDKVDGSYHNIKEGAYNVVVGSGFTNNRFELTFQNGLLQTNNSMASTLVVLQNNNRSLLQISNPNLISISSLQVFDISGKSVIQKKNLGENATFEFSTSSLSDGIYIVSIKGKDKKTFTQKIAVSKVN